MWILAFLALSPNAGAAPSAQMHDAAFREGWSLLQEERYVEARAALGKIPPSEYDLGDYIAYFVGTGAAREGKRAEAGESLRTLEEKFPDSPLLPYLHHEVAYAAALDNDVAGARMALERSHGKVGGGYRKSEEGFVAAFLAEEGGPSPGAASLHLSNFAAYTAHEAAALSFERLWKWRREGRFAGWDLSPAFYAKFAKAATRAGEPERARALFRFAYGLYRIGRHDEAIAAFEAGEKGGFGTVEVARHRYWKARALRDAGRGTEAEPIFAELAGDGFAGIYALFAVSARGPEAFRFLNAPSSGETKACGEERERLWERIRNASWGPEDAEKVRRAERLTRMGVIDYAVLEASLVDRAAARKAIGLADGAAAGLFRYLAGDLKGAIRETSDLPLDPSLPGLSDRIQYPLAPEFLADCDRPRSGIDPLVLHAIIRQESRFQPDVLSSAGAVGLMQLMPRTAAETARREKVRKPGRKDLLRPALNVRLGAAYLSRLVRGYGGDYLRAVAAYNAGEAAVARWGGGSNGDPSAV